MRSKVIKIDGKHYIAFWDNFLGIGKSSFLDPISKEDIQEIYERFRKAGISEKSLTKILGENKEYGRWKGCVI